MATKTETTKKGPSILDTFWNLFDEENFKMSENDILKAIENLFKPDNSQKNIKDENPFSNSMLWNIEGRINDNDNLEMYYKINGNNITHSTIESYIIDTVNSLTAIGDSNSVEKINFEITIGKSVISRTFTWDEASLEYTYVKDDNDKNSKTVVSPDTISSILWDDMTQQNSCPMDKTKVEITEEYPAEEQEKKKKNDISFEEKEVSCDIDNTDKGVNHVYTAINMDKPKNSFAKKLLSKVKKNDKYRYDNTILLLDIINTMLENMAYDLEIHDGIYKLILSECNIHIQDEFEVLPEKFDDDDFNFEILCDALNKKYGFTSTEVYCQPKRGYYISCSLN